MATLQSIDEGAMEVHTSVIADLSGSVGKVHSPAGNTHLIGETGPPHNDINPDFIEDWNISVLKDPGTDQHAIA